MTRKEWECGSCGAIIDAEVADPTDLYHDPDEDCRATRTFSPHENHERLTPGCPDCDGQFEEGRAAYREEKARLDAEEDARAWEQADEAARDRADWILMEDR